MKEPFQVFAVLAFAVLNCQQSALAQEAVSVYHSEHGRFFVSLPSEWEKQEQDMGRGVWGVFGLSPEEGTSDLFSENVNIIVVPADTTDLSEANRRCIEIAKRSMAQFTLLDQAVGEVGPHSASWFVNSYLYEGHPLKAIKYTLINGSKMYLVTCTALSETFERFRPVFESIVASISFSDEPAPPPSPNKVGDLASWIFLIGCVVLIVAIPALIKWLVARKESNVNKDRIRSSNERQTMTTNESGKEPKDSTGPAKISLGDILQGIGLLALGGGILDSMLGYDTPEQSVRLGYLMIGGIIVAGIGTWLNKIKKSRNK